MLGEIAYPSFLFQPKELNTTDNPLDYLTDQLALKDIVSRLCKQLHHPVAIIDYKALVKNSSTQEKLESMVEMYPMRRSCSIFRKCADDTFCADCDHFHARCMDIDKTAIEARIQENSEHIPDFFYPQYKGRPPKVIEIPDHPKIDRPVVEYRCPMLGYRELLFPIKYRDRVLGVLFAGQIMVEGDQEINKQISENFFNNKRPEELFKTFVDRFNTQQNSTHTLDCDIIKRLIVDSDNNVPLYDAILGFDDGKKSEYSIMDFSTLSDYYDFIERVCIEIAEAEDKLAEAYEERRKDIFSKMLREIADMFYTKFKETKKHSFNNKYEASIGELNIAWQALKIFAVEIQKRYERVEEIIIFGDSQAIKLEASGKKGIVYVIPSSRKTLRGSLDFSRFGIDGISDYANSLERPEILKGLSRGLPIKNSILIQCHDIAMLLLVTDLDLYKKLYTTLADAIGKELVRINSIIALCSANLTKEKYLLTLRMYRHENAHISTRLMGNVDRYFENGGQRFINQDGQKRQSVCDDMRNTVQLIANIADNIAFVTGTGIAAENARNEETSLNVVDMLYKWQIMFRDELVAKRLDIIVYRGDYNPSTIGYKMTEYLFKNASIITRKQGKYKTAPNEITINARLFELLVYNIVDNAVKYAYLGTNIYLIWGLIDDTYELSVTSYGPPMPEGNKAYGLYARGNDKRLIQGDGLGLYVVKKISEKLNIIIKDDGERISPYNVPLITRYRKADFSGFKGYSTIKLDEPELNNDQRQQVSLVINKHPQTEIREDDMTLDYLHKRIEMETWRTTFRVIIPVSYKKTSKA